MAGGNAPKINVGKNAKEKWKTVFASPRREL